MIIIAGFPKTGSKSCSKALPDGGPKNDYNLFFFHSVDGKNRSQNESSDNIRVEFLNWSKNLRTKLQNDTPNVFWL